MDLNTGAWSTREWSTSARSKLVRTMVCGAAKRGNTQSAAEGNRAHDHKTLLLLHPPPHLQQLPLRARDARVER
jgi:hypothetical protein